jgi:tetratricopeptide (TPR) repeat protein
MMTAKAIMHSGISTKRTTVALRAAAVALLLGACSSKPAVTSAVDTTSGGDDSEAVGLAKRMPTGATAGTPQAGATTPDKPAAQKDFRPKIPDAPPVAEADTAPPPPSGPSPWGAPDAQSGRALPPRPKMNDAAAKAFSSGNAAAAKDDLAGAKAGYEQALAADPHAFAAAYNLGVVADRQGQTNQALQSYARAVKMQPDYESAVEATVNVYLRQGTPDQAVAYVQPIATYWERNLYLQAILANALVEANRVDEAEQVARKALSRDEKFVPAMIALANASIRRGRLELADSVLEQALAINPKYPEIHFLQGKRHQQEGRLAQALASYRKAVDLRPSYSEARMALGVQYMAAGNYAEAQAQFEAVAKLVPTLVAVHLNLGDAYRANHRWQDAKRELDTALRMQELPEAHFNLGLLYMDAGAEFPGLKLLDALQRAVLEFTTYREKMGSRLAKNDPATAFIADLQRQIDRENKRIEREAAQKKKEAERAARAKQMGATPTTPATPATPGKTK